MNNRNAINDCDIDITSNRPLKERIEVPDKLELLENEKKHFKGRRKKNERPKNFGFEKIIQLIIEVSDNRIGKDIISKSNNRVEELYSSQSSIPKYVKDTDSNSVGKKSNKNSDDRLKKGNRRT